MVLSSFVEVGTPSGFTSFGIVIFGWELPLLLCTPFVGYVVDTIVVGVYLYVLLLLCMLKAYQGKER